MLRLLLSLLVLLPTFAFAEGRYIVELRGAPSKAQFERFRRDAAAALGKRGVEVTLRHELSRVFHGAAVTLDAAAVEAVRRLPYVAAVHDDKEMQLLGTDATHLERIGAKQVWTSLGARGSGVTVAIIDSGVDRTHPAFAGRYLGGYDFIDRDDEPDDPHGHGTHVAGTALGDGFGVAPAAKLLAYRVIDANGRGFASDVIAALERALEDGTDVVNLSLGAPTGDANEPDARAVDKAVEEGMVVVLAAGNFGGTQSIGSPATARLGITVGNAGPDDAVLYDSSYGPVHPALDLKPDVVAPGEEILSARTGGGVSVKSGTSMASPHVAGAAALLLELHPQWTPAQVKSALIGTARPTNDEVMKRGGGRIDVHRAATAAALVQPASLPFGRMKGTDEEWTATRVVRVTAGTAQTFQAAAEPQPGIAVTIEPSTFTLAAGEWRDVTVAIRATSLPPVSLDTLTFGGTISFGETRVPWIFVHAASVTTKTELSGSVMWSCGPDFVGRIMTSGTSTTLLPARDCTAIARIERDENHGAAIVLESRAVRADETLDLGRARAKYRLHLGGVDEQGRLLRTQHGHAALHRIDFGPARFPKYLDLGQLLHPIELSELPDDVTILSAEVVNDLANGRVVGVQHAPLRGVHGDRTLVNASSAFTKTRVRVLPSAGGLGVSLMNGDRALVGTTPRVPVTEGWTGDAFLTPAPAAGYRASPTLVTGAFLSAPLVASSEEVVLGAKPLFPSIELLTRETRFGFSSEFFGPMRERHFYVSPRFEARDAAGALIAAGPVQQFTIVDHAGRGAYTLTLRGLGLGTTTYAFDTRRADAIPPTLTSARIAGDEVLFTASEPVTSRLSHDGGAIRLEITDAAGNTCTWLVPANEASKRRAAR